MRIVFIRHGDPDYAHDSLTENGKIEASLLAEHISLFELDQGDFYVSPLGRAQDTARYVLNKLGKTAEVLDWLREFPASVDINDSPEMQRAYPDTHKVGDRYERHFIMDMMPSYWTTHEEYYDRKRWREAEIVNHCEVETVYEHVTKELDRFLEKYGYVREGRYYRVEKETDITITCFCHLGIICALLSHLWSVSPFVLWQSLALAPTSVTEVYTEEREQGIACFRAVRLGEITHLRIGKVKPSFAGRFCEVYSNTEERH